MAAAGYHAGRTLNRNPGAARRTGFFVAPETMKNLLLIILCALPIASHAFDMEKPEWGKFEYDFESKPWQELAVKLPPAPKPENLLPFFVSAASSNRFYIDSASVSRGEDGIVRYTLVVKSSEGAENVSFEGIRCSTREVKRYAFGRHDGSWGKARSSSWEQISYKDANRQHHVLYDDFFCPQGIAAITAQEAVKALKRGTNGEAEGVHW